MARLVQKALEIPAIDFKPEDRVQVVDREPTPEENKARIFYNHMRGLTGTVRRVYEDEREIWVDVDRDSLPETVRQRHEETEEQMKRKWLDNLSDEARRKMGEAEKRFSLRYSILVNPDHLILKSHGDASPSLESATAPSGDVRRVTSRDLNNAEEEFLNRATSERLPE